MANNTNPDPMFLYEERRARFVTTLSQNGSKGLGHPGSLTQVLMSASLEIAEK